ncbi:MAG TPA: alpha/beta fold hydrolase [Acidimicrobiales bacterium]|nr:alpha/beta fold hydrolase [Acidimicrobiales bacterium]
MPWFDRPGGRLFYRDEGAGDPPVVLLHAFPLGSAMWLRQIAALAPRHRVVAPDLRGFGASDVPHDPADYSVDRWAGDVAALVSALALPPVVVVGLSLGGYVAFALLRRGDVPMAGLVLADTRAGEDTPEIRARRTEQQQGLAGSADPTVLADTLLTPLVGPRSSARNETLARARELLAANRSAGVVGALDAMKRRPDSTALLAGIAVPTLVVVGDQDQPSPPEVAREMAGAIPGARVVVVPDAGHLTNLEQPDAFNRAMRDFLDRLAPTGP